MEIIPILVVISDILALNGLADLYLYEALFYPLHTAELDGLSVDLYACHLPCQLNFCFARRT
jgi:hypothetical protein